MDTRFTDELWESITPIYQQILEHPFIKGLTDGSLPAPAFRQYVIQDALYLQDFARSIAASAFARSSAYCRIFSCRGAVACVTRAATASRVW